MTLFLLPDLCDPKTLIDDLAAGGYSGLQLAIDMQGLKVKDELDAADVTAIQAICDAHVDPCRTKVAVTTMPDPRKLGEELLVAGVSGVGVILPAAVPGDVIIMHDMGATGIAATVAAHDPTLSTADQQKRAMETLTLQEVVEAMFDATKKTALGAKLGL